MAEQKRGLLLVNLGSPEAPTAPAVKTYLTQFLTDKYVIDLPAPVRHVLVRTVIAPFRAPKSAAAYTKIWGERGSPLVHYTRSFTEKVAAQLGDEWSVRWAMRYGQPSVAERLQGWDVDRLYIVPLYPQFAESSSRTAIEEVLREARRLRLDSSVDVLEDFYARPEFLKTQAERIRQQIALFKPDHILLSFHGLPEHHMTKLHPNHCFQTSDCCARISSENRYCYRAQCLYTARALREELDMSENDVSVSFQSRLGRRPWIKPYTDFVIEDLAKRGLKRVLVSCPSFIADCLETLEEIQMRLREQFQKAGGDDLQLVPALNDSEAWVENFCAMVKSSSLPWKSYRHI